MSEPHLPPGWPPLADEIQTETRVLIFNDGRRVAAVEHGPVEDWAQVAEVECFDQWGRIIDRYRPSNLGAAPLRRKADTNAAWRSS